MTERDRDKNDTRTRSLATHDRNYWVRLLQTVDTWFPVYRVRHPDADRAKVVAHLASLIDGRRPRGFSNDEHPNSPDIPETAVFFESPVAFRGINANRDSILSTTSGVAQASAFKVYDIETKSKSDTEDLHVFRPLRGFPTFAGTNGAFFWAGFARLDSTWDQITGSPSDRVVHMAVLQIDLPRPATKVTATLRTLMSITLGQGVEIINDWGWFDDADDASLTIDFCGAFTRNGAGFPDPQAFGFSSAFHFGKSHHEFFIREADMSRVVVLSAGDKPSLFLGMRWTFAGADSRMQTGFVEGVRGAVNSFFGFKRVDTGLPGVVFSYQPEVPELIA